MIRVLVVGQTPPPYGGQAIMIESLLEGPLPGVELRHVRMAFSRSMDELGRFSAHKLVHLGSVIGQVVWQRLQHRPQVLYYPPSGPARAALLRDCAILLSTRWLFDKTVLHFHAGGTAQLAATLSAPERLLFRLAFDRPDCTIRTSPLAPHDGDAIRSKLDRVVPNGVEDVFEQYATLRHSSGKRRPVILFAGLLCSSKGIGVLVEAAGLLAKQGLEFEIRAMGAWQSPELREQMLARVASLSLADRVHFPGVLTGPEKYRAFAQADVFCFPSYFEAETFGVAVLEAMSFELPVVTTDWRGLPALVEDGRTGFVVPVRDAHAVASKLALLLGDPERRQQMGQAGRAVFLRGFTRSRYLEGMRDVFLAVGGGMDP